jgi:hypothetical protein
MKTCSSCGVGKELQEFYKDKRNSDGRYSNCKKCHNSNTILWGKEHPEVGRARAGRWYNKHKKKAG